MVLQLQLHNSAVCWVDEAVCLFSDLATRCSVDGYKEHTGAYEVEYAGGTEIHIISIPYKLHKVYKS